MCRDNIRYPHLVEDAFRRRISSGIVTFAGSASLGSASLGSASLGSASLGSASLGSASLGSASLGSASTPLSGAPSAYGSGSVYPGSMSTDIVVPKAPIGLKLEFVACFARYFMHNGTFPLPSDTLSAMMIQILMSAISKAS